MSTPAGTYATLDALILPAPTPQPPETPVFESSGIGPLVSFLTTGVQPPSPLYISITDRLQFTVWNDVPFIELDFVGRLLEPDGSIKAIFQPLKPVVSNSASFFTLNLAEGFLLSFAVTTPTAGVTRGQCFVNVALVRGSAAQPLYSQALVQEYVSLNQAAQWPGGRIISPLEGPGVFLTFRQTNLAGVHPVIVGVSANRRWRVRTCAMTLITDAVVANRSPFLQVTNAAGQLVWEADALAVQAASLTHRYSFGRGVAAVTEANGNQLIPLPADFDLDSAGQFTFDVSAFDAGDTIGEVVIYYEQVISP